MTDKVQDLDFGVNPATHCFCKAEITKNSGLDQNFDLLNSVDFLLTKNYQS